MAKALLCDSRATLVCLTASVCVLESADRSFAEGLLEGTSRWARVFENYYLANSGDDRAQGVLVGAFFDWLAVRYKEEIEPSRNVGCYEDLYNIASNLRGSAGADAVLDLGCGPGTILRSSVTRAARLLAGFDISQVVAKTAESEGMVVLSREQFLGGTAQFDVALSAYTMHYACDLSETFSGVQRSLKSGGIWAMNFHKDIGIQAFLERLDSTPLKLTTRLSTSTYGSILAVTRR
jgi:SAM-dependent methyltransferase